MQDIEIARSIKVENIKKIAKKLNLDEQDLYLYGTNKAKILKNNNLDKKGKLILVTAINPTPYGEGKTTVSIGLADALAKLNKNVCLCLRQPSLGPVFGLKGGATGGGYSQIVPMDEINLHFTGDFHAITSCNQLISAAIYNHIEQGNYLKIDKVIFDRCADVNDRTLRSITFTCQNKEYTDSFRITSASEIMALFSLATSLDDLKKRLGKVVVGLTKENKMITVHDLKLEGALTALLKDAFYPNLVQTLEQTPALVHGGPFANIAHGCSSVKATTLGLSLSDYVVTEAGFGSDLGAEKFLNIVCPTASLEPSTIVLVVTIRALKHHGNNTLKSGLSNLQAHIDHLKNYHVPIVVAINKFSDDSKIEIDEVKNYVLNQNISCEESTAYIDGGKGALSLAMEVIKKSDEKNKFTPLVDSSMTLLEKLEVLCEKVYHANEFELSSKALEVYNVLKENNLLNLPICVAKTQYSISDNSKALGYPKNTTIHIKDLKLNYGAGFITVLLGNIMTMPGLPKQPNYEKIDVVDNEIIGIF